MHPGLIDNKPLIGLYGDELSRTLVENVHFILLPDVVFQALFKEFKGGELKKMNSIHLNSLISSLLLCVGI